MKNKLLVRVNGLIMSGDILVSRTLHKKKSMI